MVSRTGSSPAAEVAGCEPLRIGPRPMVLGLPLLSSRRFWCALQLRGCRRASHLPSGPFDLFLFPHLVLVIFYVPPVFVAVATTFAAASATASLRFALASFL